MLIKKLTPCCDTVVDVVPNVQVKCEYKHDVAAVEADLDLGLSAVNASGVVAYNSWLAGYQTSFDIGKSVITKNNFGIGELEKNKLKMCQ